MRRGGALLLAVAIAAALVAAVAWRRGDAPPAAPASTSDVAHARDAAVPSARRHTDGTPGAATVAAGASATAPVASKRVDAPLPTGPLGQTHATLVQRARAGDARAAQALAEAFSICEGYEPGQREKQDKALVAFASDGTDTPGSRAANDRERLVWIAAEVLELQEVRCPGIESLGVADRAAERDRWLALALDLGHPAAMVEQAGELMKRYPMRDDIINHAEELKRLRPQAFAMVERAAAQGEPLGLLRMATAHAHGDLADRDPVAAYAYLLAYRDGPPVARLPPAALAHLEERLLLDLTTAQREAAQARALRIREQCCGG